MNSPRIIEFNNVADVGAGYIAVAESLKNIPFDIKRVYWVYDTPSELERGNHANIIGEHVIICITGSIEILLENQDRTLLKFKLNNPNQGLYVPPLHWRKLNMTMESVCLSLSSVLFHEEDYIRDYSQFLSFKK